MCIRDRVSTQSTWGKKNMSIQIDTEKGWTEEEAVKAGQKFNELFPLVKLCTKKCGILYTSHKQSTLTNDEENCLQLCSSHIAKALPEFSRHAVEMVFRPKPRKPTNLFEPRRRRDF
eukprot:TRINITY_DN6026_c0_g2_i3.p1 TRINITY_DN6026_c0_g2~~TRINITY_DN6026_c0_g2_i3.p1  ORF type:complete len:117 (+),score=25.55 TRINITY_DN6026_c0_g2_i3:64-414(+)